MVAIVLALLMFADPSSKPADPAGHWEGKILLPGSELTIKVDLDDASGVWMGSIDIPPQGAYGLELEQIVVELPKVEFRIHGIGGEPTFKGELKDGHITGSFTQGPIACNFDLGRDQVAPVKRQQDPVPPLPYDEEFVKFDSGAIKLAGTLTIPRGKGPFPAVVMITGSGPQNRDEELFDHRPFRVIADRLTRAGIAVLRYDDRGIGESKGSLKDSTTNDFKDDAVAAVAFLQKDARIARARIGLMGHSEGAIVAPMAASESKDVAFIVMLAGTGVSGADLLPKQIELLLVAAKVPQASIDAQLSAELAVLDALKNNKSADDIRPLVVALVKTQNGKPDTEPDAMMVNAAMRQVTSPWFKFFVTYDPRLALRKVHIPVLALNGEKDLQVNADQNLPEIEKALKEAGNKDVTIVRRPGLNHLFQPAKTGLISEYGKIPTTFDEETLKLITDWITKRFGQR